MPNQVEILLCEDNPRDAELTIRALKKRNLSNNVQWVRDGEEALEYLFATGRYEQRSIKDKPKVVLLDLKMPKVDGLEVLKEIRTHPETKKIPVVILTSSKEENDIVQSYEYGVNSYIVKPVNFEKFLDSIADVGFYWLLLNQPGNR
ncbi:response regulator [Rhodohalobacter sp. 614A]|uniref:response regulator n=1 Tax=Rhodohalobacter sp. 614A TaxID=2908649 RepID=UPI001F29E154|nr:response regulator [Rhodohalobacter sp. 614A]